MGLIDKITNWIRTQVKEALAEGVVVGLSGGIDSSVVATLSKMALGDDVLALIMPCHSDPIDEEYANLVARMLNIKTQRIVLDPIYDRLVESLPYGNKIALANLKPRLRMLTLYYFANTLNYLVVGTGNKSELMVGYFTKYGDGGVDLLPLGGLLKSQVMGLAKELGIPEEILKRTPTAGLWKGQTDEGELGISYDELDEAILALEFDERERVSQELLSKVEDLIRVSSHKRSLPKIFIPQD